MRTLRLAGVPRALVEHLNTPPLSDPTKKVVSSLGLNEIEDTPISLSERFTLARSARGRLSTMSTNLWQSQKNQLAN